MKKLVIDLETIKNIASSGGSFFVKFRSDIKKIPVKKFDEIAFPIIDDVTRNVDCTQCGNCCKFQEPGVTDDEISKLANFSNITKEDFKNKYVSYDHHQVAFLCKQPCIFLEGSICSIYKDRPGSCADFPGLHRPGLKWRINQMQENYGICPIVFNVVERIKEVVVT